MTSARPNEAPTQVDQAQAATSGLRQPDDHHERDHYLDHLHDHRTANRRSQRVAGDRRIAQEGGRDKGGDGIVQYHEERQDEEREWQLPIPAQRWSLAQGERKREKDGGDDQTPDDPHDLAGHIAHGERKDASDKTENSKQ